jgi:DNA-binding NarL/FixJ family response regulator
VDVGWGTNDDFERLARLGPRLVLLDLEPVPVATIVRDIAGILPEIGIIALNQDDDPERAIPLIESGIAGLTLRSASLAEVVESIHAVLRGEFQCPPVIAAALVRHAREHAPGRAGAGKNELTPRERQVLALLEHGHSQKEVATLLSISPSTVRVHVHSALKKISGRAQGGGQGDGTEVQRPGLAP